MILVSQSFCNCAIPIVVKEQTNVFLQLCYISKMTSQFFTIKNIYAQMCFVQHLNIVDRIKANVAGFIPYLCADVKLRML